MNKERDITFIIKKKKKKMSAELTINIKIKIKVLTHAVQKIFLSI